MIPNSGEKLTKHPNCWSSQKVNKRDVVIMPDLTPPPPHLPAHTTDLSTLSSSSVYVSFFYNGMGQCRLLLNMSKTISEIWCSVKILLSLQSYNKLPDTWYRFIVVPPDRSWQCDSPFMSKQAAIGRGYFAQFKEGTTNPMKGHLVSSARLLWAGGGTQLLWWNTIIIFIIVRGHNIVVREQKIVVREYNTLLYT